MTNLSQSQLDHFKQKGWLVVNDVFHEVEMEQLKAIVMELLKGDEKPKGGLGEYNPEGEFLAPRKINQPFLKDPRVRDFVLDQRIRSILKELIGKSAFLATDQVFLKPPLHGSAKPYHQDNAYFRAEPADEVITAWIALDAADAENGCLHYINGSHLGEIVPHSPVPGEDYNMTPDKEHLDMKKEEAGVVKQGGIVFHHSKVLHGSPGNRSKRWRRGYATHWMSADVKGDNSVVNEAYFRRPEFSRMESLS